MAASFLLALCGGYLLHSFYFTVISMLICIAARSIATEYYLSAHMHVKAWKSILHESIFAVLFLVFNQVLSPLPAFILYLIIIAVYLSVNFKKIAALLHTTKQLI